LELSCRLVLKPGDEVIVPSWTFPSTANAVILAGGIPVFIDVDQDLNLDANYNGIRIVKAITSKTKAIMPIHYAGVLANMSTINYIAEQYGLYVIEDAAQAIGDWKVSGDLGCLSFHSTKNVQCGEGGAIVVKNLALLERLQHLRYCGTTRAKTTTYEYVDVGTHALMSHYTAEHLHRELLRLPEITAHRRKIWSIYSSMSDGMKARQVGNGHLFWFFREHKWEWIKAWQKAGIKVSSHYDALHLTEPGKRYGRVARPITRAVSAMRHLVKLNTSVTEEEAMLASEVIWPQTEAIRSIL
jgi:dTDP-4-amino-4,6-dideoxygalactose transaminase